MSQRLTRSRHYDIVYKVICTRMSHMNPELFRQISVSALAFSVLFFIFGLLSFFIGTVDLIPTFGINNNLAMALWCGSIGGFFGFIFPKVVSLIICIITIGAIDI